MPVAETADLCETITKKAVYKKPKQGRKIHILEQELQTQPSYCRYTQPILI